MPSLAVVHTSKHFSIQLTSTQNDDAYMYVIGNSIELLGGVV